MDTSLDQAILQTIAYADIFNYPLTLPELERYLMGIAASDAEVSESVCKLLQIGMISVSDGLYTLARREHLVALRRQRSINASKLWPPAIRFGLWIARLPFVRMVAVTGALAVNNVTSKADIDYLLVTEPGRLWISRFLVIAVVRLAALSGVTLCPNYIISENALVFEEQNIYTAHDLIQMVPLAGWDAYNRLCAANRWINGYLPNSLSWPWQGFMQEATQSILQDRTYLLQRWVEAILRHPWVDKLEAWEMRRKIRKFESQALSVAGLSREVSFCADWCKGHFDRHRERTLDAFTERLEKLESEILPLLEKTH